MAAGYSGTPQARKLGLKPGQRVALDHPPARWHLTEPPPELTHVEPREPADVVISFFGAARELPDRLPGLVKRIIRPAPCGWPGRVASAATTATSPIT